MNFVACGFRVKAQRGNHHHVFCMFYLPAVCNRAVVGATYDEFANVGLLTNGNCGLCVVAPIYLRVFAAAIRASTSRT